MKRILFLTLLFLGVIVYGQDVNVNVNISKEGDKREDVRYLEYTNVSLLGAYSEPYYGGISLEMGKFRDDANGREFPFRYSHVINVYYGQMNYELNNFEMVGKGFVAEIGHRVYGRKNRAGGFYENSLVYGKMWFEKELEEGSKIKTGYEYWSIINPSWGYRFQFGKVNIDPFLGFTWKWEVRSNGDMDLNPYFNNFVFKGGLRIGITATSDHRF